jgi:hypothetical protein
MLSTLIALRRIPVSYTPIVNKLTWNGRLLHREEGELHPIYLENKRLLVATAIQSSFKSKRSSSTTVKENNIVD